MVWLLVISLALVVCLSLEAAAHQRRLEKISHRIAVTGIRGKSSITRLIAAGLSEAGYRVMAKTTGSKPVIIYPDGHEKEVKRRGKPTVLEQKNLVRLAAREGADFLVAEMMSIQSEYLRAESHKLLQPEVLVLSNIRVDHTEFLGKTKEDVATNLCACLRPGVKVFMPEEEIRPEILEAAEKGRSEIKPVGPSLKVAELISQLPYAEFESNLRLALAVLEHYEIPPDKIRSGIKNVCPDFGHLRAWPVGRENGQQPGYFINLFAANDPCSTEEALKQISDKIDFSRFMLAGLLSFRSDRADRTAQWLDYLRRLEPDSESFLRRLDVLFLAGPGAVAVKRCLSRHPDWPTNRIALLKSREPDLCLQEIFRNLNMIDSGPKNKIEENINNPEPFTNSSRISSSSKNRPDLNPSERSKENPSAGKEAMIIGLGNIVGLGQKLIDYLERESHAFKL